MVALPSSMSHLSTFGFRISFSTTSKWSVERVMMLSLSIIDDQITERLEDAHSTFVTSKSNLIRFVIIKINGANHFSWRAMQPGIGNGREAKLLIHVPSPPSTQH